ncbi:hypothetical protein FB645_002143 [Coemansia sp. IMI 203386]|nr:hypothetical protein FB645_002143 [Coemansia sp. IMI 203386]
MEAEIPAASLKSFYKALQCLARIGTDISFEATAGQLMLIGVSASRSAYASFAFQQQFFDAYELLGVSDDSSEDAAFRCRVQAKLLVGIFKARSSPNGHAIERCTLRIEQTADHVHIAGSTTASGSVPGECRLVVQMIYKEGIRRTHRLFYEVCEVWRSEYDKDDCKSRWRVGAKVAASWIGHFARGLEEVSLRMSPRDIRVRSWAEGHYAGIAHTQIDTAVSEVTRALQTELAIDPADFDVYRLASNHAVELTFGLREFRAILQYAEAMALPLAAYFNGSGDPILFTVGDVSSSDHALRGNHTQMPDDMVAEFAVATIGDVMTTASGAYSSPAPISVHGASKNSPHLASFTPQANVERRVSQLSIQDTVTPLRPLVCQAVDAIELHSISPRRSAQGPSAVDAGDSNGRPAPSPSEYPSSRGSHILDRGLWASGSMSGINRADSLLCTPESGVSGSRSRATTNLNDVTPTRAGAMRLSAGNTAALSHDRGTTARSYRLLDMPRPHAPAGVTDSQLSDRDGSLSGSDDELNMAPQGMVQTRLPFQNAPAKKPQGRKGTQARPGTAFGRQEASDGDKPSSNDGDEDDEDDDEELGATPPPPSKRIHII